MPKKEKKSTSKSTGHNLASCLGKNLDMLAQILPPDQFERLKNAAQNAAKTGNKSSSAATPVGGASMSADGSTTALSTTPTTPTDGGGGGGMNTCFSSTFTRVNVDGPLTSAHLDAHNNKGNLTAKDEVVQQNQYSQDGGQGFGESGEEQLSPTDGSKFKGGANATEPPLGATAMVSPMLRAHHHDPADMPAPPPLHLSRPSLRGGASEGSTTPASPIAVAATPTPGGVARFPSSNCPFASTGVFQTREAMAMASSGAADSRRGSGASFGFFDPPFQQMESMDASESFACTMRPTVGFVDATSMQSSRSRENSVSREPSPIADSFDPNSTLLAACETSAFPPADRGTVGGHRRSGTVAPPTTEGSEHAFRQPNPLDADCFKEDPQPSNEMLIRGITSSFQHANDHIAASNTYADRAAPFLSLEDTQRLVSLVTEVRGALAPSAKVHWVDISLRDSEPHSPFAGKVIPCTPHEVSQWEPPAPDYPCNDRLKAADGGQVFKRLEKALATGDVDTAKGIFLRFPETDVLEGYNVIMDKGISALYDGSRTQRVGGGLLPPWHSAALEQKKPASSAGDAATAPKKKMKEVLPPEMDIFSGKSERGTASWLVEAINGRRDGVLELLLWQFERSLPQPVDMLPPLPPLPHPSVIASSASMMMMGNSFAGAGVPFDSFAASSNRGSEVTSPINHQQTGATVYIPRLDIDAFAKLQCYNRRRRKQLSGILHAARVYGLANFKITEEALALTAVHVTISPLMRLPGDALTDEQILTGEEGCGNDEDISSMEGRVPLNADAERIIDKTLEFIGEFADYEKGLFGCCYGFDEDGEETFQDVEKDLLAGSTVLQDGGDFGAHADGGGGAAISSTPSGTILPAAILLSSSAGHNSSGELFSNHSNAHVSFSENNSPVPALNTRSRSPSISLMGGGGGGGADYPATLLAFAMHYLGLTPSPTPSSTNPTTPPTKHQHTFAISYQTLVNVLEAVDANTLTLIEQERSELEKDNQQPSPSSKSSRTKAKEAAAAAEGMKHPHDIWFPGLTSSCFWDRFPDTASLDFYLGQRLEVFLTVLRLQQIWYEQETYEQQHFAHGESELPSNDDILKAGSDEHNSSSLHNTPTPRFMPTEALPSRRESVSPARKLSVFGSPMSPRRFSVSPAALSPLPQSLTPRASIGGMGALRRSESMHSIQSNATSIANASFTSYSVAAPVAVFSRKPQLSALSMGTMDQHMKALKLEEAIERIRSRKREKKGKSSKVKKEDVDDEVPLHPDDVRRAAMRIASSVALSDLENASPANSFLLGNASVSSKHGNSLFCNSISGAMLTSGPASACASPLFASKGGSSILAGSPVMVPAAPSSSLVSMSASVIDAVERRHYNSILLKDDIQTLRNRLMATCKEETKIVSEMQPVLTGGKAGDGDESEVSLPPSFDMEVMNIRSVEYVRQYVPPIAVTSPTSVTISGH